MTLWQRFAEHPPVFPIKFIPHPQIAASSCCFPIVDPYLCPMYVSLPCSTSLDFFHKLNWMSLLYKCFPISFRKQIAVYIYYQYLQGYVKKAISKNSTSPFRFSEFILWLVLVILCLCVLVINLSPAQVMVESPSVSTEHAFLTNCLIK